MPRKRKIVAPETLAPQLLKKTRKRKTKPPEIAPSIPSELVLEEASVPPQAPRLSPQEIQSSIAREVQRQEQLARRQQAAEGKALVTVSRDFSINFNGIQYFIPANTPTEVPGSIAGIVLTTLQSEADAAKAAEEFHRKMGGL